MKEPRSLSPAELVLLILLLVVPWYFIFEAIAEQGVYGVVAAMLYGPAAGVLILTVFVRVLRGARR